VAKELIVRPGVEEIYYQDGVRLMVDRTAHLLVLAVKGGAARLSPVGLRQLALALLDESGKVHDFTEERATEPAEGTP